MFKLSIFFSNKKKIFWYFRKFGQKLFFLIFKINFKFIYTFLIFFLHSARSFSKFREALQKFDKTFSQISLKIFLKFTQKIRNNPPFFRHFSRNVYRYLLIPIDNCSWSIDTYQYFIVSLYWYIPSLFCARSVCSVHL